MNQPDLSQVIEQIAAYLHVSPDQIECVPIRHGTLERNNVWRLNAAGRSYLLKQHLITQPVGESILYAISDRMRSPFEVASGGMPRTRALLVV